MRRVIIAFIIWRVLLFITAAMSPIFIPQFGARFPYYQERLIETGLPHFIWSFGNFDGVHYLGIAKNAYADQYTQAFFPLYPIVIKAFSFFTLGNLLISALLISNLSFLIGLLLFYHLVSQVHNPKIALWSALFLLAFPTSYYFGAVYTEGLFFLMIIASFYLASHQKIWQASLIGAMSSATRIIGLFIAPFLRTGKSRSFLPFFIVPLGFLIYVLYLQIKFNNPLYFLSAQSIFGQERSTTTIVLLPQVIFRYLKIILTTQGPALASAIIELSSTIFVLIMLFLSYKKVKTQWFFYSLIAVLVPTLTGTFASMPRYIIIAFPIYIVLASIKNILSKTLILIISIILLIIFTAMFAQGYWVA